MPGDHTGDGDPGSETAAAAMLLSLGSRGVEYVFANLGTDHTPILEARARLVDAGRGEEIPEVVTCHHEFVAMSAAHGYAAVSGQPQAVLVHVDVGTQNLGGAMHNAHRANVPVVVISGIAPVTDAGHPGSRDHVVHYEQDVFDQPGIVREYCRWTNEFQTPADPDTVIGRALERATGNPQGPVYLTAAREALEATVESDPPGRAVRPPGQTRPTDDDLGRIRDLIEEAARPVVITSDYEGDAETFVSFAETAGAGVVEHSPTTDCFPSDHPLHLGFDPSETFTDADLVLTVATDVPWVPAQGSPDDGARVVRIDETPTAPAYPHWDFRSDVAVAASPEPTLAALAESLDPESGEEGRTFWESVAADRRADLEERLAAHRDAGKLTPTVLSDALNGVVDETTIVLEDAVTSRDAVLDHLDLAAAREYHWKGGAGLGWAGGAGVGAKLASPDARVVSLVGDGSYLFAHPSAYLLFAASIDAPTLTVAYNNGGWNAVEAATRAEHPDGAAAATGVAESDFDPVPDLTAPAGIVDTYAATVETESELVDALGESVAALEEGRPAVLDVRVDDPDE